MARGKNILFEVGEFMAYGTKEHPGAVTLQINGELKTLTAEEATTLAVALNNYAYPHTRPRG